MFTVLTTSSLAATKVTFPCGTFAPAQTGLRAGDLALAGRCVR
jgi:hypothetical protein